MCRCLAAVSQHMRTQSFDALNCFLGCEDCRALHYHEADTGSAIHVPGSACRTFGTLAQPAKLGIQFPLVSQTVPQGAQSGFRAQLVNCAHLRPRAPKGRKGATRQRSMLVASSNKHLAGRSAPPSAYTKCKLHADAWQLCTQAPATRSA
jgi:hypothetical protein